ncbi:GlsB/YeaQ/YmgE family stress response membrane protein [Agrococcus jejuensis]|uniref:Uncharacterized protein n=1 Tax=Agrococcus jejuensis TaxID=399736 RepID=A0A1G8EH47_9MICO|nr:hypothetical protein [Agrococcus jejuensis]SDH69207.1 hypothetical protein SAMN04489720_2038 [Agrococcus jejuensis]
MTSRPDDAAAQPADDASQPADATAEPAAASGSSAPVEASDADVASESDADAEATESARADEPVSIDRDDVQVRARLVPRYGRFMVLGAIVGAIGGWLWSRLGSSGPWLGAGPVIDTSAIVPFLVAVGALAGIVLGAVVAIVLDRLVGRRRRTLTAERTRHHRGDLDD